MLHLVYSPFQNSKYHPPEEGGRFQGINQADTVSRNRTLANLSSPSSLLSLPPPLRILSIDNCAHLTFPLAPPWEVPPPSPGP